MIIMATVETDSLDTAFLDTLTPPGQETTCTQLNNQCALFKLDTGTEVTATNGETYEKLGKPKLDTPDNFLYGPARHTHHFKASFSHKERTSQQQVYVVDKLKTNLLRLPAITALNLAARIEATIPTEECNPPKQFPNVFKGLGNFGQEFTIKLKPDATPHVLYTSRHAPLPLRPKVQEELE